MTVVTINAFNYFNYYYYIPVQFGGPPTQYLLLDTGSSDTWAIGTSCVSTDASCTGPKMGTVGGTNYGYPFEVIYGGGAEAFGEVYSGSPNFNGISPSLMYYGNASEAKNLVANRDGILGLGQLDASDIYTTTGQSEALFMNALGVSQYGLYFNNYGNVSAQTSCINIGGYNSALYNGSLTWLTSNSNSLWQISASGGTVSVYGNNYDLTSSGAYPNLWFDTGVPNLAFPLVVVNGICSAIPGCEYNNEENRYTFSCTSYLPNIVISVSGNTWTIPGYLYSNNYTSKNSGAVCSLFINTPPPDYYFSFLGAPFHRVYYTAYNLATKQIGYALAT
jgi:hypothetical protein